MTFDDAFVAILSSSCSMAEKLALMCYLRRQPGIDTTSKVEQGTSWADAAALARVLGGTEQAAINTRSKLVKRGILVRADGRLYRIRFDALLPAITPQRS